MKRKRILSLFLSASILFTHAVPVYSGELDGSPIQESQELEAESDSSLSGTEQVMAETEALLPETEGLSYIETEQETRDAIEEETEVILAPEVETGPGPPEIELETEIGIPIEAGSGTVIEVQTDTRLGNGESSAVLTKGESMDVRVTINNPSGEEAELKLYLWEAGNGTGKAPCTHISFGRTDNEGKIKPQGEGFPGTVQLMEEEQSGLVTGRYVSIRMPGNSKGEAVITASSNEAETVRITSSMEGKELEGCLEIQWENGKEGLEEITMEEPVDMPDTGTSTAGDLEEVPTEEPETVPDAGTAPVKEPEGTITEPRVEEIEILDEEHFQETEGSRTELYAEGGQAEGSGTQEGSSVVPVLIDSFTCRLTEGAEDRNGTYIYDPSDPAKGHPFIYRIEYSMSGTFSMEKGAFKIEVPLHILKDRDGNWADTFDCPYYQESELTEEIGEPDFVYSIDEERNTATIYNYKPHPTGDSGYIEISYSTSSQTFQYEDMAESDPVPVKIYASNEAAIVTKEAIGETVSIDTHATISYTQKRTPDYYSKWKDAWGEKPVDADEYVYLVWTIRSYISKCTSPYEFILDDTFTDLGGDVVGYKFSGQTSFSGNNRIGPLTSYGDRYDYVLTRCKKSIADEITKDGGRYEVKNSITATVHPKDGLDEDTVSSASKSWWYEKRLFSFGGGEGFWSEKYGIVGNYDQVNDSEDISSYNLAAFQSGEEETLDGLRYSVYGNAKPYPWTLAEGAEGTVEDAINGMFGQKKIDLSITDDALYLDGSAVPLNGEDYDFTGLELSVLMRSAAFDESEVKFREQAVGSFLPEDAVTVWVKDGAGSWIQAAVFDMQDKAFLDFNSSCVDESSSGKDYLKFKGDVDGIKITCSNAYYRTQIRAYPEISLNRTENVLSMIGTGTGKTKVSLTNSASFTASQDGVSIYNRDVSAKDYMQGVEQDSEIKKDVVKTQNNKKDSLFSVQWSVSAMEKYADEEGIHPIYQQSGTFYDLLPIGTVLDKSSISVSASGNELLQGSYTVDILDNYRESGRSMLAIRILEPTGKDYKVSYTTIYSYDAIKDYGKNLLNSVAYETGNSRIADGFPDNGGNVTDRDLLAGLDPDCSTKRFLYAEARYNVGITVAASTGLKKQVKSTKDAQYTSSTVVNTGDGYSYQVRLGNDSKTQAKNIVFFDSLENFYQESGNTAALASEWKGELLGIDLSNLRHKGVAPKVYLSWMEGLNPQDHHDLDEVMDGKRVWVRYETFQEQYGLSKARAVAIDAGKTPAGTDFLLKESESVSFVIYMKAPDTDTSSSKDPKAYNNIYVWQKAFHESDEGVDESQEFFHYDYTEARFRVSASLHFKKVDEADMETPVKDAVYRLSGTSDYGTEYLMDVVSARNGSISFEDIERGTYTLAEISCPDDWQIDREVHQVVVHADGTVEVQGIEQEGDLFLLPDKERIHADLSFQKYDSVTDTPIPGTEFRLMGTSDYGNQFLQYAVSDFYGKVTFKNLELGTYELYESKAVDGYIRRKDPYTVKVVEPGTAILYDGDTPVTENETGNRLVFNEPYHEIRFLKSSTYGENIYLEGAQFLLTGISDYGTKVEMEAVSASAADGGLVVFGGLEPGTYILKETKAPKGHDLDTVQHMVSVKPDGSYEISGLVKVSFGGAEVYDYKNTKTEGMVCITKKWDDGGNDSNRFVPDISISTGLPSANPLGYTITFDANTGVFGDGSSQKSVVYNQSNAIVAGTYSEPLYTGKVFEGWYTDAQNGEQVNISKAGIPENQVSSDMTLYAHWKTVGLKNGSSFNSLIPSGAESVQFVYEKAPEGADLIDVDNDGDGGVVGWLDGTVFKVSTQIDGVKAIANEKCDYMFRNQTGLTSISMEALDTSKTTTAIYMFLNCSSMTDLDLGEFNTSNMTNIGAMFQKCKNLASIDVSRFDTSKVTNIGELFSGCEKLESIDLSNFNTANISNMNNLFNSCRRLESLDLSSFNTSKVTRMEGMFAGCTSLKEVDISSFDTSNTLQMQNMFYNCSSLESLDVTGFRTGKVTSMSSMFEGCSGLSVLDTSGFDTSNVTSMRNMFARCKGLQACKVSGFNTGKVTDMYGMFYSCGASDIDVSGFDTSNAENMANMFLECRNVKELDVSGFATDKVTTMKNMFAYCDMENLDLSNFNTENVTDMHGMFYACKSLLSLDLSHFNTGKVAVMGDMFNKCHSLLELDLSSFDTSDVTEMYGMFYDCPSMEVLNLSGFDTSNAENMEGMFSNMLHLKKLVVGTGFAFMDDASVPSPSSQHIPGADGKWYNLEGEGFLPAELPDNVADTYYAAQILIP